MSQITPLIFTDADFDTNDCNNAELYGEMLLGFDTFTAKLTFFDIGQECRTNLLKELNTAREIITSKRDKLLNEIKERDNILERVVLLSIVKNHERKKIDLEELVAAAEVKAIL